MLITLGDFGYLTDEIFTCPTNDGEYMGRNTLIESIPTGRFGTNRFRINSDMEIKALVDGVLGFKKENGEYHIHITNSIYEVVYFSVDTVYVENNTHVSFGENIGGVESNSILAVKILVNGKHIIPTFACNQP